MVNNTNVTENRYYDPYGDFLDNHFMWLSYYPEELSYYPEDEEEAWDDYEEEE